MFDYLIVGSGLYGAVLARELTNKGKKVLVIDQRKHLGGNCYTENKEGINIHKYGPHIFNTNNENIWLYVNKLVPFNNFVNRPKVNYKDKMYSFPINLMTFHQLWDIKTPQDAQNKLQNIQVSYAGNNLKDYAISTFGTEIYEKFIEGYTTKQWMRDPETLPADIIKRLVIRTNFNDNYYNSKFQGIPIGGYTSIFIKLLDGIEVKLDTNYFNDKPYWDKIAHKIIFTGKIDEFYDYCYGELEYRTQEFEEIKYNIPDYQGNAIVNYTKISVPYTRIIEHKHFEFGQQQHTIISREYPKPYNKTKIPMYPINDSKNNQLYKKYKELSLAQNKVIFGGRLGEYKYYDMDAVIALALQKGREL